ncbi:MAG: ABC transporter ATP-binding protein [Bacillota bacterium]
MELAKSVLKIENLSISFGGLKAVDDLSFEIADHQIYGLIGPNGAGKTTVFNCITKFYSPDHGKAWFRTKQDRTINLLDYRVHEIVGFGMVRTFQNVELIKELSILDNLLIGAHSLFRTDLLSQALRLPHALREEKAFRAKALHTLDYIGLAGMAHQPAGGQPYGTMKKIELARTLMSDPKLIILDEPAAGLNDTETEHLAQLIQKIRDDYRCSVLLVEHDMALVMGICEQICAISFGKKLAEGSPTEIQHNQAVQEAYLGRDE